MSDEDALVAAIAAHPDEDTPRLAYADWLDENGRPVRAEFIRLQCGLKVTATRPKVEQRKVAQRLKWLIDNHRRELIPGPLGVELTAHDVTFDRGFAAEVRVTALQFVLNPDPFPLLVPLPKVRVRNLNIGTFNRFVARPELTCVTALAVNAPPEGAAFVIASCPCLERLETLDWAMAGHRVGDAGLEALAFADELSALTELLVPGNEISDVGVARLVASPLWRRLRRLNLARNQITAAGASRLADAPANGIELLDLRGMSLGVAAQNRLASRYGDRVLL